MKRTHATIRRLGACAWLALAGWAGAAAPQRDWPQVPVPGDARAFWVAEYIEQNTVPMQIRGLESRAPMKEVSRYYEKWLAERPGYGVTTLGAVRILGARFGDYQVTVQLRDTPEGTIGRLVSAAVYEPVGDVQERSARIGRGFPRPAGSQVVSDTLSWDQGQRNRTIVVTNGVSVETNALYLREQLLRLGWTLVQDRTIEGGQRSALVFRRTNEEMAVTIVKRDQAYVVTASQTSPE